MTPLTPEALAKLRRIARDAQNTYVGRNWPSMAAMRRDGIGHGLVEDRDHERFIRLYLDTFQPEFMVDLLATLAPATARETALREALRTAWDIIQANPIEDTCRHLQAVDLCDGEDDEPCIDRSRRERIRAALDTASASETALRECERCGKPGAVAAHYGLCCDCIVPFDNEANEAGTPQEYAKGYDHGWRDGRAALEGAEHE